MLLKAFSAFKDFRDEMQSGIAFPKTGLPKISIGVGNPIGNPHIGICWAIFAVAAIKKGRESMISAFLHHYRCFNVIRIGFEPMTLSLEG
jgi:hypothetical protein